MRKCATPYCRNRVDSGHCHKCRSRRYKKKHPFRYHYNVARPNARRRGIEFLLTFEQYKKIWLDSGKWEQKKNQKDYGWQMDRIDPRKGYEAGNVQILTLKKNIMKYYDHDRFMMDTRWIRAAPETKEAPF